MNIFAILNGKITQAAFAQLVGVSEAKVSQLVSENVIPKDGTGLEWLHAYVERLREQAAGRMGAGGGLDLPQERAALARSQRIAQDLKNAIARGQYAPIGLLADVLGAAAAGVVDRFEQLDGALKKACPDLPEAARTVVQQIIASARNEWIRSTENLVAAKLEEFADDDQDASTLLDLDDGAEPQPETPDA